MITELRPHYKPFEYQTAFDFYKQQHQAHWLADEVPLASDLNDWKMNLTESEKLDLALKVKELNFHHMSEFTCYCE